MFAIIAIAVGVGIIYFTAHDTLGWIVTGAGLFFIAIGVLLTLAVVALTALGLMGDTRRGRL
jgi:hypothetical protein